MSQTSNAAAGKRLLNLRTIAVLLVLAPVFDVAESALSPLANSSTTADVAAISAHPGRFALSVLLGIVATSLFLPALVGLMSLTVDRAPRLSRVGTALVGLCMLGWMGVRMGQAFELTGPRVGLSDQVTARLVEHSTANPIGGTIVVLFLLGNVVGLWVVAVTGWRTGLPKPAVVLLVVFPIADLALESSVGSLPAHLLLLVALAWIARAVSAGALATALPGAEPLADGHTGSQSVPGAAPGAVPVRRQTERGF